MNADQFKQQLQDLKVVIVDAIEDRVKKLGDLLVAGDTTIRKLDLCEAGRVVNLTLDNGDGEATNYQLQQITVTDEKPHGTMTFFLVEQDGTDTETRDEDDFLGMDADTLTAILDRLEEGECPGCHKAMTYRDIPGTYSGFICQNDDCSEYGLPGIGSTLPFFPLPKR